VPELPEVEVTCRNVARWTSARRVRELAVDDPAVLRSGDPTSVVGANVAPAYRRAKLCLIPLGTQVLVVHLRMTGKLVRAGPGRRAPRLRLTLDDGCVVVFEDVRRLGQAWLVLDAELPGFLATHAPGAEPWPVVRDGEWLRAALSGKRGPVKTALMDGRRISGVGNIGASEACWRAAVDPQRRVPDLSPPEWSRLMDGVRGWIGDTIAAEDGDEIVYLQHGGVNPFHVYGRAGAACPRCGAAIARLVQSGRATFHCAGCQA